MTKSQKNYMETCFALAEKGKGKVAPNPMVGALIVHNNEIIGSGYHEYFGGPHAEVNAINSVAKRHQHLLSQSTIYVSLEPCAHHGKTPPCVDLILESKIPKVVISVSDPNPKVNGSSIKKLQANGVEVVTKVLEKQGMQLIKTFLQQFRSQSNK